jgi:hypothetical protein
MPWTCRAADRSGRFGLVELGHHCGGDAAAFVDLDALLAGPLTHLAGGRATGCGLTAGAGAPSGTAPAAAAAGLAGRLHEAGELVAELGRVGGAEVDFALHPVEGERDRFFRGLTRGHR